MNRPALTFAKINKNIYKNNEKINEYSLFLYLIFILPTIPELLVTTNPKISGLSKKSETVLSIKNLPNLSKRLFLLRVLPVQHTMKFVS